MGNRTMIEINHDFYPKTQSEQMAWLGNILAYLRSGNPRVLPDGVTFFNMRHHSDNCPLGEPPLGWHNERPPTRKQWGDGVAECPGWGDV
jgi:hypothetical protein